MGERCEYDRSAYILTMHGQADVLRKVGPIPYGKETPFQQQTPCAVLVSEESDQAPYYWKAVHQIADMSR